MNTVQRLTLKLADATDDHELLRIVRDLRDLGTVEAAAAIATVLDTPGPMGRRIVRELVQMGPVVMPAMLDAIETGIDEDAIRNAHRVLAALGDEYSARAQHAHCWADVGERPVRRDSAKEVA